MQSVDKLALLSAFDWSVARINELESGKIAVNGLTASSDAGCEFEDACMIVGSPRLPIISDGGSVLAGFHLKNEVDVIPGQLAASAVPVTGLTLYHPLPLGQQAPLDSL